jgi:hypothetical protein
MREVSGAKEEIIRFLFSVRVSKLFYQFRDVLQVINGWLGIGKGMETVEPDFSKLTPEQVKVVEQTIAQGKSLVKRFQAYKAKLPFTAGNPEFQKKEYEVIWGRLGASGVVTTELVSDIVSYLEANIKKIPKTQEVA